jgi:hypothetical protein
MIFMATIRKHLVPRLRLGTHDPRGSASLSLPGQTFSHGRALRVLRSQAEPGNEKAFTLRGLAQSAP